MKLSYIELIADYIANKPHFSIVYIDFITSTLKLVSEIISAFLNVVSSVRSNYLLWPFITIRTKNYKTWIISKKSWKKSLNILISD